MGLFKAACLFLLLSSFAESAERINLAQQYGQASQIDAWDGKSTAEKGIDGNTSGSFNSGMVHTRTLGTGAWWKVVFPQPLFVEEIVIFFRTDCCMHRSGGMTVSVDGVTIATLAPNLASTNVAVGRKVQEIRLNGAPIGDGYIQVAEVQAWGHLEDIKCYDKSGREFRGGESYTQSDGKICTCGASGIICRCEGEAISCPTGTSKWTDQITCTAKCITSPAYCSSSGDPHYRTFDGKYYDFHGVCTYQAASCGDFTVNFKNVDLHGGRPPRYTKRAELVYKGVTYAAGNGYQATVNGQTVQVPYVKSFTNGDRVEIVNNGQLEIRLIQQSKGKNPAVRVRASNAGSYIQAEMWLHGSCADITEGLCGNWNGNPNDDLTGGSPNSLGTRHELYDENCPAPPRPYHPCDDLGLPDARPQAEAICNDLLGAPFSSCHSTVSPGDQEGGVFHNCMTDVCNCLMDTSCACSQYDNYASSCIDAGVDLSNWRESISYCPYECPDGLVYLAAGSVPAPTCLDKNPDQEGTVRGCFCPSGQYLQDGVCVPESQCRCLFEGSFYESGDVITKEGECQECTCGAAGEMSCGSLSCDIPTCPSGSILASKDDLCCPYCEADWVVAVNPEETVKQGHDVTFTCEIHTDVSGDDITWSKDGQEITEGVSRDGLRLRISDAQPEDSGSYTCAVTKDASSSSAEFTLTVERGTTLSFNPSKTEVRCKPKKKCQVKFKVSKEDGEVDPKSVRLCKLVNDQPTNCSRVSYKKKKKLYTGKIKKASESDSGDYVIMVPENGKDVLSEPISVTVG